MRDSVSSEPINLTGCSAIFAIGRANSRRIVTTKIIGNGITVVDASAGRLNVEIDAEDTEELSGVFRHELADPECDWQTCNPVARIAGNPARPDRNVITVSVEADISEAMRFLNLLPREANRAAYRAMNKIADEIKKDSAKEISTQTGIPKTDVFQRMYVRGASASNLIASVHALPSAKNVGYYKGAWPVQGMPGVVITAWRKRTLYDRAFVKGPRKLRRGGHTASRARSRRFLTCY